jgi:hypothetical protein
MATESSNEISLKMSETHDLLVKIIKYNIDLANNPKAQRWEEPVVPYLTSTPGTGKTSITIQASESADCDFRGFIGSQYDPAEMAGFIFFDQHQRVTWRAKPDFLTSTGKVVVLCDEFAQMTMMQKNIMAQLIQERRLGEHHLSPHATLVLAGNRAQDRAGVQPDPSHVTDRVFIINVMADFDDWASWALANGIRPEIVSYLKFRGKFFNDFDPAAKKSATPRGWTKVSTFLNMGLPPLLESASIQGQVGPGAATDFTGYLRVYRDLPDIDMVLKNPTTHPVPDVNKKPDVIYALCGALSFRANSTNIAAVLAFADRMPGEFEAMTVKDAIVRDQSLRKTKPIIEWLAKKGTKLFL